jgi:hypothetical protein
MALNSSTLAVDIGAVFAIGTAGADVATVAKGLTSAIVSYSSSAQILMLPGPIVIPAGGVPSIGQGALLTVLTAEVGRSALEAEILSQLLAKDPTLGIMSKAIQKYVSTFTAFQAIAGHTATGVTVMAVQPALIGVITAGVAGADLITSATQMATLIHAAYLTSVFNGVGLASDTGVGPVAAQVLM